jgi:hypothetical protein
MGPQFVHVAAKGAAEYCPGGQSVQKNAISAEYFPIPQLEHSMEPTLPAYFPESQFLQSYLLPAPSFS